MRARSSGWSRSQLVHHGVDHTDPILEAVLRTDRSDLTNVEAAIGTTNDAIATRQVGERSAQ